MIIKQIYTSCLSEASYIISSENDAVVIDPLREPFKYIDYAKKNNLKIWRASQRCPRRWRVF